MITKVASLLIAAACAILCSLPGTSQASSDPIGQTNTVPAQSFEVASVSLSPPNDDFVSVENAGSPRFTARNITMKLLVGLAFGVSSDSIVGAPNWFDSQKYDVNAKAEGDSALTPKQFQPLLQQLLKERFHLAVHLETKERAGYALEPAKGGPKLLVASGAEVQGSILRGELRFPAVTLQDFAGVLAYIIGSPVADRTGIPGNYEIRLTYAPIDATDSLEPSIFMALQEQLGLKLTHAKVPVESLVIDHADRIPTEN